MDYNELFGLTEAEGEEEREIAEPAEDEGEESADEGEAPEEGEGEEEREVAEPDGQTKEENARYAAARRKAEAERDREVEKVRKEAADTLEAVFRDANLTNPYTGKPIRTKAEYDEYITRFGAEQKKAIMEKSGMTDDELTAMIGTLPEVREAKRAAEELKAAEMKRREEDAKAKVEAEMAEIAGIDPAIKTVDDLKKMDTYDAFRAFVDRGLTLTEAFRLANFEKLREARAEKAAGAAARKEAGKAHMSRTASRGTGDEPVPEDIMREYRRMDPKATEEEIRKHYNRYLKG